MTVYNPKLVEALVLIRDGLIMTLDGVNILLGDKKPEEIKLTNPTENDFNSFNWQTKESSKGNYEQANNNDSKAFRILQNWLSEHKGFANLHGYKLWFHINDENLIDRRRA